jgi:hypothetical protein
MVNCRWLSAELRVSDESSRPVPALPGSAESRRDRRPFLRRPALYPALYAWYVLVSALDILFTWRILRADGIEVNVLANWVIDQHDIRGLVVFKFLTVVVVILICEVIGRRQYETGAKLARWWSARRNCCGSRWMRSCRDGIASSSHHRCERESGARGAAGH